MNHSLLNRRRFLGSTPPRTQRHRAHVPALREGLLGASSPIRPLVDSSRPYAPRPTHFAPKAQRVLCIFCSGAFSHVDTFDYKPELVKRHDTPMPGSDKLVTFQGEQGNLIKPLWDFKPRGQSGKMISDLLPNLAELADDMCFIHSMTAKSNTHGPAENQMSTGFTLDGFPSMGSWASYALGSECAGPAGLRRHSRSARRAADRPAPLGQRLPARRVSGHRLQCRQAHPQPRAARFASATPPRRPRAISCDVLNEQHLAQNPGDTRTRRAHRQLRTRRADAARAPPKSAT